MSNTKRNSNHEMLRLIAMYMIVFIHANMYLPNFCGDNYRVFFNGAVNGICNIGVTCFILISGYYGVKFDLKKLVKMECMMISYSLVETIVLWMVFPEQMQGAALLEQVVKSLLPFITRKYWFYSCYVCLLLLSGYIQKFIDHISKKEFQILLAMLLAIFSVFPTLFYFEVVPDNGKGLLQMMMIYLLGRYIRMYGSPSLPRGKALVLFLVLWVLNGVSHEFPIELGGIYHHLCKDNSITNVIMAVILFYLFKEMKLQSDLINGMAAYVFAVFALNNSLVSVVMEYLGNSVRENIGGVIGFLILMSVVLLILLACLIIGKLRELLFGRADRMVEKVVLSVKEHGEEWVCRRFH